MAVPTQITDLSQTAGTNGPVGSVDTPSVLDDHLRAQGAFIAQLRDGKGFTGAASVASATTTSIGAENSLSLEITGTTTITGFGTTYNGPRFLLFAGALTLIHSGALNLPGGTNITTSAGDTCVALPNAAGNGWYIYAYQYALAASARSRLGLVIGSDVPSPVGAGASGTWGINISGTAAAAVNATYAAVAANALGKMQSYGNYLPYRSLNMGFQNLAGRPIGVTFTVQGAINAQCKVVVTMTHGGVPEDIVTMTTSESNGGAWNAKATSFFCVVPESDFLTVSDLVGTNTLTKWTELR